MEVRNKADACYFYRHYSTFILTLYDKTNIDATLRFRFHNHFKTAYTDCKAFMNQKPVGYLRSMDF